MLKIDVTIIVTFIPHRNLWDKYTDIQDYETN
jgi:hypothetical protein